jgi:hypothetical protein
MEVEFKQLKSVYEKVKFLLNKDPNLIHDSDRTIFTFYFYELGKEKVNEMSGYDVFAYFNSKFTEKSAKIDSISRARRLVLQKHPELKEIEIEVSKTLFKIKNAN